MKLKSHGPSIISNQDRQVVGSARARSSAVAAAGSRAVAAIPPEYSV